MSEHENLDAIAAALARMRGRRGRGGPHGHHGAHRHHGPPPFGRTEEPALMRMLEALAAASDPLSVSDLATAIDVDQPRASRLVQQGVAKELVVREADPDDARRTRIALTERGRQVAGGARGRRRENLASALESLTTEERTQLAALLTKLSDS